MSKCLIYFMDCFIGTVLILFFLKCLGNRILQKSLLVGAGSAVNSPSKPDTGYCLFQPLFLFLHDCQI